MKMYRQIRVDERDVDYQRILWTDETNGKIIDYQLLTVTYGMTCALFLAQRVLQQLVHDDGPRYPLAIPVLTDNTYVDDTLFGADNEETAIQTRDHLVSLLRSGGFELRKWASNSAELLANIATSDRALSCDKSLSSDERINVLGVGWNPANDTFAFKVTLEDDIPVSKRTILSAIARLFDPLGWVAPVIISAKILMQRLWQANLTWDSTVPATLLSRWKAIYSQLSKLNELAIARWTGLHATPVRMEFHGFADASRDAYAAVIYLKVVTTDHGVTTTLLMGKSRVAPLKSLTIPRLELCAALLLARLMDFVRKSLHFETATTFCWTDSSVVLAWVSQHPGRWKPFVAHRVTEIQSLVPNAKWRHVPTSTNPADCASRGLLGDEILDHQLWWHGPPWMASDESEWPRNNAGLPRNVNLEERVTTLICTSPSLNPDLSSRFSSWPRLLRVTAYILRFRSHSRRDRHLSQNTVGFALSAAEISAARTLWLKSIQSVLFHSEITALTQNRPLARR